MLLSYGPDPFGRTLPTPETPHLTSPLIQSSTQSVETSERSFKIGLCFSTVSEGGGVWRRNGGPDQRRPAVDVVLLNVQNDRLVRGRTDPVSR